jgi:flagellar motor switch protein FliG
LAVALFGASESITDKIRKNISERVTSALDEEISLMQDPTEQEVLQAREEVVGPLRDMNEQGTLRVTGR